jgi:hypothetical protein
VLNAKTIYRDFFYSIRGTPRNPARRLASTMPFRGADESLFTKMIKILFFRQIFPFPRKTEGFYQKR